MALIGFDIVNLLKLYQESKDFTIYFVKESKEFLKGKRVINHCFLSEREVLRDVHMKAELLLQWFWSATRVLFVRTL